MGFFDWLAGENSFIGDLMGSKTARLENDKATALENSAKAKAKKQAELEANQRAYAGAVEDMYKMFGANSQDFAKRELGSKYENAMKDVEEQRAQASDTIQDSFENNQRNSLLNAQSRGLQDSTVLDDQLDQGQTVKAKQTNDMNAQVDTSKRTLDQQLQDYALNLAKDKYAQTFGMKNNLLASEMAGIDTNMQAQQLALDNQLKEAKKNSEGAKGLINLGKAGASLIPGMQWLGAVPNL